MPIPVRKIITSSSDHVELLPAEGERFAMEAFYKEDGMPQELFSYCKYQLDVEGERWKTLALITNCKIPYLRTHYYECGNSYPCGRCQCASPDGEYSRFNTEKRDKKYPIVAKGIAAIFAWDLEYDNEKEDFLLPCEDGKLLSLYYDKALRSYLIAHNTRRYLNLTTEEKERAFLKEHLEEEKLLWAESEALKDYPLLYEYSEQFVNSYFHFLESRIKQLEPVEMLGNGIAHIPSIFDNIPQGVPVVFISYSWDSDEHKAWVKKLSDDLRQYHKVYTILDQYNSGGYDLINFMKKGMGIAHRVLIIGTPRYKEKSEHTEGGGVRFEDQLVTIDLYRQMGSSKFIPILREGSFSTSFSDLMGVRTGYDFSDDSVYAELLKKLAADIYGQPLNAPPALGESPNIEGAVGMTSATATVNPNELSVGNVKVLLNSPNGLIDFTELVEEAARKSHEEILQHASYNFPVNKQSFKAYKICHLGIAEPYLKTLPIVIRYGTSEYAKLYVDAMVRFCTKPFKNGEITMTGTEYLHFLAPMFIFHTMGLLCVKYQKYEPIMDMMKAVVPAPNPLSPSHGYTLAHMAGTDHWGYDVLNILMDQNWLYPYSRVVRGGIYEYVEKCFLNKDEFESCYAAWEYLFSLAFGYYKCNFIDREAFPVGEFALRRLDVLRGMESFFSRFLSEAETRQNDWMPLKQGLFDGSYENYKTLQGRAEEYYKRNMRY